MKKLVLALAAAIMLVFAGLSGCCYDVPENGQFCFIIVPIFGETSTAPADTFSLEPVDCRLLR